MIRPSTLVVAAALAVFAASALAQPGAPFDVRAAMQQRVNPAMLAIWDVTNNAMDEAGGIDPARMDENAWQRIAVAASELGEAAEAMAAADRFVASAPDNAAVGEGEIAMSAVQEQIDGDPQGLRDHAAKLAAHAARLAGAARTRDAATAGSLVAGMDVACEGCHARYWYPE